MKHWRRLNPYICKHCGKKRSTLVYDRRKRETCTKCEKTPVQDGPGLFEAIGGSFVGVMRAEDAKEMVGSIGTS